MNAPTRSELRRARTEEMSAALRDAVRAVVARPDDLEAVRALNKAVDRAAEAAVLSRSKDVFGRACKLIYDGSEGPQMIEGLLSTTNFSTRMVGAIEEQIARHRRSDDDGYDPEAARADAEAALGWLESGLIKTQHARAKAGVLPDEAVCAGMVHAVRDLVEATTMIPPSPGARWREPESSATGAAAILLETRLYDDPNLAVEAARRFALAELRHAAVIGKPDLVRHEQTSRKNGWAGEELVAKGVVAAQREFAAETQAKARVPAQARPATVPSPDPATARLAEVAALVREGKEGKALTALREDQGTTVVQCLRAMAEGLVETVKSTSGKVRTLTRIAADGIGSLLTHAFGPRAPEHPAPEPIGPRRL